MKCNYNHTLNRQLTLQRWKIFFWFKLLSVPEVSVSPDKPCSNSVEVKEKMKKCHSGNRQQTERRVNPFVFLCIYIYSHELKFLSIGSSSCSRLQCAGPLFLTASYLLGLKVMLILTVMTRRHDRDPLHSTPLSVVVPVTGPLWYHSPASQLDSWLWKRKLIRYGAEILHPLGGCGVSTTQGKI